MGDMGDDFRAWKQERVAKRASQRENGAKLLREAGIAFEEKNIGAHLIVSHAGKVIDYWPGTGKWKIRDGKLGRGVFPLLKALTQFAAGDADK